MLAGAAATDPVRRAACSSRPPLPRARGDGVDRGPPLAGGVHADGGRYPPLHPRRSEWALLAGGLLFAFVIGAHLVGMERYSAHLESARETLHISESRFRAISESAADGIITVDAHGTIVHCNAAAMREFGYAEGGLLGRNVRDLVPATHLAAHAAGLEAYRTTGRVRIGGEAIGAPALRRDGSEFPVELSWPRGRPTRDGSPPRSSATSPSARGPRRSASVSSWSSGKPWPT